MCVPRPSAGLVPVAAELVPIRATGRPMMTDKAPSSRSPRQRRMAREPQTLAPAQQRPQTQAGAPDAVSPGRTRAPSKLDMIEVLLRAPQGATIAELMAATGWQQHTVRGALAGALKKRGIAITSDKPDGVRHYRAESR